VQRPGSGGRDLISLAILSAITSTIMSTMVAAGDPWA